MNRKKKTPPIIYFLFIGIALAISIAIAVFAIPEAVRFPVKVIVVGIGTCLLTFVGIFIHSRIRKPANRPERRR